MRWPITFLFLAFALSAAAAKEGAPSPQTNTGESRKDYAAEDFDACMLSTPEETWAFWDSVLSDDDKKLVMNTSFDDLIMFHRGWGMGIRNGMCLWKGGPLKSWFESRGVTHPDSMSHILIQLYWAYLNACRPDVDAFVESEDLNSQEHLGCA